MKDKLKSLIVAAMQAGTTGNSFVMKATLDAADVELAKLLGDDEKQPEANHQSSHD